MAKQAGAGKTAHNDKIFNVLRVLDTLCPTPGGRKERMKIDAGQESGCGIRGVGSRMGHPVSRAAITENIHTSYKAFGCVIKAFQRVADFSYFRLAAGGEPAEGCDREWAPASADAQGASTYAKATADKMADKEIGAPNRPEGGVEDAKGGRFRLFCCRRCKFVRLCPRLPALSAFARLSVERKFLSGREGSDRMLASNGMRSQLRVKHPGALRSVWRIFTGTQKLKCAFYPSLLPFSLVSRAYAR